MTDQALVNLAFTMLERAYVPYSHFPVGAALLCADGTTLRWQRKRYLQFYDAKEIMDTAVRPDLGYNWND